MFTLTKKRAQRTLKKSVSFSGIGVHTGREVSMQFSPAPENTGIIFHRTDLPGSPFVPATVAHVCDNQRSTILSKEQVRIHTVEHVLAALRAFDIDNLHIEISNIEPPIADGSSKVFVQMIQDAGIKEQSAEKPIYALQQPVFWHHDDEVQLVALPDDKFRISYTLSYPNSTLLSAQFHSITLTSESFTQEIAPSRTFSLYEEVAVMMDKGLIKGGSLDNAVVIQRNPHKQDVVFSKEGLRFPNEMVRHKILDVIGDLALVPFSFYAHIISIRSGHASNYQLAKKLALLHNGDL